LLKGIELFENIPYAVIELEVEIVELVVAAVVIVMMMTVIIILINSSFIYVINSTANGQ
jgi:hypothetical protein